MRKRRWTTAIALLMCCALAAPFAPRAAASEGIHIETDPDGAMTLYIDSALSGIPIDTDRHSAAAIGIIGGEDGPMAVYVDSVLVDTSALQGVDFDRLADIQFAGEPDVMGLYDALTYLYEDNWSDDPERRFAQIDQGLALLFAWCEATLYGDVEQPNEVVLDTNQLEEFTTREALVFRDEPMRIDMRCIVTSSDADVLRVTTYGAVPQADDEDGDDALLVRDRETSPMRLETLSEGDARLVVIYAFEVTIGSDVRTFTHSLSVPERVVDEGAQAVESYGEVRRPYVIPASEVLGR